jgi:hypothetical protein
VVVVDEVELDFFFFLPNNDQPSVSAGFSTSTKTSAAIFLIDSSLTPFFLRIALNVAS